MRTIYKYPLSRDIMSMVNIPVGYKSLHVGNDPNGILCMWVMCDPEQNAYPVEICVVGTGQELPEKVRPDHYAGSVSEGPYMWHVFDLGYVE